MPSPTPPCPLQGCLLALKSCERALNEYMAEAANAGAVPTVKAINDLLGYIEAALSDCGFEIAKADAEEHAREIERDLRDEAAYERSVRSLVGQV